MGEGFERFWYQGHVYHDDLTDETVFKTRQPAHYVWWAKLKNAAGKTGWTKQTDQFSNQDACG